MLKSEQLLFKSFPDRLPPASHEPQAPGDQLWQQIIHKCLPSKFQGVVRQDGLSVRYVEFLPTNLVLRITLDDKYQFLPLFKEDWKGLDDFAVSTLPWENPACRMAGEGFGLNNSQARSGGFDYGKFTFFIPAGENFGNFISGRIDFNPDEVGRIKTGTLLLPDAKTVGQHAGFADGYEVGKVQRVFDGLVNGEITGLTVLCQGKVFHSPAEVVSYPTWEDAGSAYQAVFEKLFYPEGLTFTAGRSVVECAYCGSNLGGQEAAVIMIKSGLIMPVFINPGRCCSGCGAKELTITSWK